MYPYFFFLSILVINFKKISPAKIINLYFRNIVHNCKDLECIFCSAKNLDIMRLHFALEM